MKRYIRTKDGKIFDKKNKRLEYQNDFIVFVNKYEGNYAFHITDIIAEADNIFDLIQVGDLVKSYIVGLEEHIFELSSDIDLEEAKQENVIITQLYTKQGDNFILVWDKERGII